MDASALAKLTMSGVTPEQVFNLHPKIRWAGVATEQGEVVFSQMRPGVKSYSPADADQSFMQMGPLMLTGVCERLAPWAGPLETVVSTYEKVLLIVVRVEKSYLAMTVAREDAEVMGELFPKLMELGTQ